MKGTRTNKKTRSGGFKAKPKKEVRQAKAKLDKAKQSK